MSTTRYQEGSIERVQRAKSPDVWVYRWRESSEDGRRVQRKKIIGDIKQYKNKSLAKSAVAAFRAEVNVKQQRIGKMTVAEAWEHFQEHELSDPEKDRSQSTIENYHVIFNAHILPRWRDTPLDEVKSVAVRAWLRSLKTVLKPHELKRTPPPTPRPLSTSSKVKIKSRMYSLFEHARHHELHDKNPIDTVAQKAKRLIKPDVLTLGEIRALTLEVSNPAIRLAVLVAGTTGLRRSEARGLKWQDIDTNDHWLTPTRGTVRTYTTNLKTKASGETIPIPEALSGAFNEWREKSLYCTDDDWVFASPATGGKNPYWFDSALYRQLRPAAKRAKISKKIGWHTFRRSLATVLTTNKESVKVVQELMRHANSRITMDLYAQGEEKAKRSAQEHVSGLFVVQKKAS
jgi:integrase